MRFIDDNQIVVAPIHAIQWGAERIATSSLQIGVTEQTYYRWRREYGGLKMDQAKRLKELEKENGRLRKAVADLTLDKLILGEAAKGNF